MKRVNDKGQAVYVNYVVKHNRLCVVILAASGQMLKSRGKADVKSRTFVKDYQAEAWLRRNGYTTNA